MWILKAIAIRINQSTNKLEYIMQVHTFKTKTGKFEVSSYGNGWAYEIVNTQTGASIWCQDDDAKELETYTANFKFENVIQDYVEALTGELHTETVNYPKIS